MSATTSAEAWPFLIARGRRRGYSVLLAPHFLVADRDHGFLEDVVGPTTHDQPVRTELAASPHGRRLVVVWTDHRVSGSDLSAADSSDITEDPVDEHSRPLRLLHGFVATGGQLLGAAPADLERTRAIALDTYRRFIADEENFTVESSSPVPITPPAPPKSPADTAVSPVHSARSFPAGKSLLAIGLLAILVVLGIQLFGTGPDAQSFTGTAPEVHDLQLDESVVAIRFTEVDVDKAVRIELVMGAEQPRSVRLVEDGRYALDQAQPYKLRVSGAGTYDFSVEQVP